MQSINNTTPLSSLLPSNTSNIEHSDLKNKISDVTCSTSSPKETISASFKENFSTSFNKKSLDFLFSSSGKEAALRDIFLNSNNTYAKSEITEFSNVLYSLVHQNNLQFDNEPGLQKIVNQYSDLIIKDKLSKDSVFGPWSAKNKKAHALRQNIEHRLAQLAQKHTSGEALSLGQKLLNTEVSSFIKNDILGELKLNNDVLSSLNLDDLIDSQAKLAFDSLREHRRSTIENSGFGIGKLSRDLNTVAILPELLKKVFTDIANDIKEQHPTPSSQEPSASAPAPDEPDSGLKHDTNTPSQPVIHYHINNDNRTYDNRVFDNRVFDNSFHEVPTSETSSKPSQVNDPLYTGAHSNVPSTLADKVISVHPHSVSDATQTFSDNPELDRSSRSGKATSAALQKQTAGNTPSANSTTNAAPAGNAAATAPDAQSVNPGNSFFRGRWTLNVQD
ncbi:invasin, partial [Escherichia coli]